MSEDKQNLDQKHKSYWTLSKPIKKYPASLSGLFLTGVGWYIWLVYGSVMRQSSIAVIILCLVTFLLFSLTLEGKNIILLIAFILHLLLTSLEIIISIGLL